MCLKDEMAEGKTSRMSEWNFKKGSVSALLCCQQQNQIHTNLNLNFQGIKIYKNEKSCNVLQKKVSMRVQKVIFAQGTISTKKEFFVK